MHDYFFRRNRASFLLLLRETEKETDELKLEADNDLSVNQNLVIKGMFTNIYQ